MQRMAGLSLGLLTEGIQGGAHEDLSAHLSQPDACRHLTLANIQQLAIVRAHLT